MTTPRELKELFERGVNISEYLRERAGVEDNTSEIIDAAYDLQSGMYVRRAATDPELMAFKRKWGAAIARLLLDLGQPHTLLEAGVGEATTLSAVLRELPPLRSFGFDLSWSRVAIARQWLQEQGVRDVGLCTGDLLHLPFADNSIDVVFTSHAIEPNRGREVPILRELHRVARKYVVLLEPAYELASDEIRARMDRHGYCRGLKEAALGLGCEVVEHRLFPLAMPPTNPTALTLIRKHTTEPAPANPLACPRYKTPLQAIGGALYSPEALAVYPVLGGIPCLRIENAILASKFVELTKGA